MAKKKTTKKVTYTKDGKTVSVASSRDVPIGGTVTDFGSKSKNKSFGIDPSKSQVPTTTVPAGGFDVNQNEYVVKAGDRFSPYDGTPIADGTMAGSIIKKPGAVEPLPGEEIVAPEDTQAPQATVPPVQTDAQQDPNNPEAPATPTTPEVPATPSTYNGSSVVDYLKSIGQDSGFSARAQMAKNLGIQSYAGSASQNELLLSKLRNQMPSVGNSPVSGAIAGLTESGTPGASAGVDPQSGEQITTPTDFKTDIEKILQEFGITPPSSLQSPQTSFSETYQQVYENLGLADIKQEYDDASKEYSKLQDEKIDKISEINNNPWYTEGVRVSKLRQLDEKYEMKESNMLNKIKLAESMYENGRQDAQFVTSGIVDQYNKSQNLTQDIIMRAIDIAEKRSEATNGIKKTADIQEYEYAKEGGYKGTFTQYMDRNKKTTGGDGGKGKDYYTPTQKQALKQAGVDLTDSSSASYFLNTPTAFQDMVIRERARLQNPQPLTVEKVMEKYDFWYNEIYLKSKNKSKSTGREI